ncbi:MAG: DUF1579 domain-containing protein [Propionibacteriales bacterium]|nr:DUF1579 domain-containing protein [Propionibacteriales bacterium]
MTDTDEAAETTPDPALKQLDRFVGSWSMEGSLVGSDEKTIKGETTFRWLPGGFFLEQHVTMDFAGFAQIDSLEVIGYDAESGTFPSTVYSNMSPMALPYTWSIDGDTLTITVSYGPMDATFTGQWSGDSFSGGWRPNPAADETINVAYDIGGRRV